MPSSGVHTETKTPPMPRLTELRGPFGGFVEKPMRTTAIRLIGHAGVGLGEGFGRD